MKNSFFKGRKPTQPQRVKITSPKLKVKTLGYINLVSRRQGATAILKKGIAKVKTFASRKALKAYQLIQQAKERLNKSHQLAKAFAVTSFHEARILIAKLQYTTARKTMANTADLFSYFVTLHKSYMALNSFKYSLPKYIRVNLF